MNAQRGIGILLLVIGVILLIVGMNASDSLADQASNFFTGYFTDATMWYIIGGIVMSVSGLALIGFGRRFSGRKVMP